MSDLSTRRKRIRRLTLADEDAVLAALIDAYGLSDRTRRQAVARATQLVADIRNQKNPGLMEVMLAEYSLSTEEGVALMCLAEALLRVPDAETIDALIEDKIAPAAWSAHLGKSSSPLVNASTWALMLTGKVQQDGQGTAAALRSAIKRLGEPVIRAAVRRAMKEMGGQFILGETIDEALRNGQGKQAQGYAFSYDMLGEAALTAADAQTFFDAYSAAIARLSDDCGSEKVADNPGISIKLSALHPRYETGQRDRVMRELVDRAATLARAARAAGMGLNIDAEEADRLDLSLDVVEAVLRRPELAGWDGFGVVVQAYGKRASATIDWLYALAQELDRRIMVRLVKGAYWDTEIKRAQVEGLSGFPVFTRKAATDAAYLCCAQQLLRLTDRIYPQFATHNAHSIAAILELGEDRSRFEFQRLHGMGEALHDAILAIEGVRSRIYAPVGAHRDLLAYLVRRLLENGANSSFVNQIVDADVPAAIVARDPFDALADARSVVVAPRDLFGAERPNSRGWDLRDPVDLAAFDDARQPFQTAQWTGGPLLATSSTGAESITVRNPANPDDVVGTSTYAATADVDAALAAARPWSAAQTERRRILHAAADLYERNAGEIFALLARESGKTALDAVGEIREAVDFLRYYGARAMDSAAPARGVFACISPWNFPLAIFTGQIAAALAAGNGVVAKPAESTSLIASLAVGLLREAGVPATALQLLPGEGGVVGARLAAASPINGVCFTGSTATAQAINSAMAGAVEPTAPLIAETGGLNAMIVDSTALPEQAVRDVVASAFQSAGQRCSALRALYLQDDIADAFLTMLFGAMDELTLGDPWSVATDVGPVIDAAAQAEIEAHIAAAKADGRLLKQLPKPARGNFVPPTVIRLSGIAALEREIFGPVLHVARFKAGELRKTVAEINATGYGLTFGVHSRINARVGLLADSVAAGNIYVNRNQIGAIVGSQPFGGEGLSGTGPKAGGPHYVSRFRRGPRRTVAAEAGDRADRQAVEAAIRAARPDGAPLGATALPGPTGESNRLVDYGRGVVLCLGPTAADAEQQADAAIANGCGAVRIAPGLAAGLGVDGVLAPEDLETLPGFAVVVSFAPDAHLRALRQALARRDGPIIPLLAEEDFGRWCRLERHTCIDTTAAGGNVALLAAAS